MCYAMSEICKLQMSMSVKLAMVAVNKSAPIQLDHLSAHAIGALVYHLVVTAAMVRKLS